MSFFDDIASKITAPAPASTASSSTPAPTNPQSKFVQNAIKNGSFWNSHVVDYGLTSNKSKESYINNSYAYTFSTQYGPMTFIPESFVNQGLNASNGTTYLSPWFTNKDNLNKFALDATYVDLSDAGKIWDNQTLPNARGYVIPGYNPPISHKDIKTFPTSKIGGISGLATRSDGSVVYKTGSNGFISVPPSGQRASGGQYINTGFGNIFVPTFTDYDGSTPYYTPPPPEKSNNIFDKVADNFGSVVKLAALVTGNPALYAFSAGISAVEGDWLGAAMGAAGAVGNTPGVDPSIAATAKNVHNGLQLANAIKNDNPIGALTALSGMSGMGLPPEFSKATQLIAINNAIQRGDISALAVAVGNIAENKDLAYAGKAANVVNAIKTGDIKQITNSLYGFLPELKEGYNKQSITAIFDKMGYKLGAQESNLLEKGLSSSADDLVKNATDNIQKSAKDGGWDNIEQLIDAIDIGAKTKADYLAMKDGYANSADKAAQGGYKEDDALAIKAGWDSAQQQEDAAVIGANSRADYLAMKDGWADEAQRVEAEKVGRYSPDEWKEYGIQDSVAKEAGWNSQADKEKASWYKVEDPNQYAELLIARDHGFIDGDAEKNIADMKEAQSYGHYSYNAYQQAKDEAKSAGYPDLDTFQDAQKRYDFLPKDPEHGVPSYSDYKRAQDLNIDNLEDYLRTDAPTQAKAQNFDNVDDYIEAKNYGVSRDKYYDIKSGETVWPDLETYSEYTTGSWENGKYINPPGINAYKQDLVDQGIFPDTQTFDKFQGNAQAYQAGYKDNAEVVGAEASGYNNPAEYRYAKFLYDNGILGKDIVLYGKNYGREFPTPTEFAAYANNWGWSDPEAFATARQTNYFGSPQEWEANKAIHEDAFKSGFNSPGEKQDAANIGAKTADEYNKYKSSAFYRSILFGDSYIDPKDAFAGYLQSNGDFDKFNKGYQQFINDPQASEFPDYKTYAQFGGDADTYHLTNLVKGESVSDGSGQQFQGTDNTTTDTSEATAGQTGGGTTQPPVPEQPPVEQPTQEESEPTQEPPPDYSAIRDYFTGNFGPEAGWRMFSDYMTANNLGDPEDYRPQLPIEEPPAPEQPLVPEEPETPIIPEQPPAVEDGTTDDIQDLINQINGGTTTPVEPPAPPPVEPEATDDGTTDGIQDVIKDLPNLEGGDLGMTEEEAQNEFYRQIGIDPNSLSDSPPATQEEIDAAIGMYPQAAGSTGTKLKAFVQAYRNSKPSTPTPPTPTPPGPTTPNPPTTPTTPTTPTGTPTGSNSLLALLALDSQPVQQQQQPTPLADIKYYYDFNDDIGSNIFAGDMVPQNQQNTQGPATFSFFDGGEVNDLSVEDLIGMLKGD